MFTINKTNNSNNTIEIKHYKTLRLHWYFQTYTHIHARYLDI